jgi:hypothetical protein
MTSTIRFQPINRRIFFLIGTLALGLLTGCSNIDNFDVPVDAKATIPAATILDQLLDPVSFGALESIDFTQELKNQGVTKSDVDSVHLKTFSLTIPAPAGQTFDFMDSVSFSVTTDGQPTALVAKLDSVPKGATKIDLKAETALELAPYVVAPSMRMTTSVKGKRPTQETTIAAHLVFDIDVNVTGK